MSRTQAPRAEAPTLQATPEQIAGMNQWVASFRPRALSAGITPATFDTAFAGAQYNPDVVERDRNQAEFNRPLWDYLASAVSDARLETGAAMLREHGRTLDEIEARFGVEKHVVVAVWGMESNYGRTRGTTAVIPALATLAYDGRRGQFFEQQLVAALRIIQNGDTSPQNMTGSWAGAMGHTQFIPTSYLEYAVDFRGDGRRDIWSEDPTDALASTASYLARSGWTRGQPWGVEVRLPDGFSTGLAGRGSTRSTSEWANLGVRDMNGRPVPDHGAASIIIPTGIDGPAFMTFRNFTAITRYNNSEAYVLGVGHLADRLRGGPPIQASWPGGVVPLTLAERMELQQRLTQAGFDTQGADGLVGQNTIRAIQAYQRANGLAPDGFPTIGLLNRLR